MGTLSSSPLLYRYNNIQKRVYPASNPAAIGSLHPDITPRASAQATLRLPFLGFGPEFFRAALAAAGCADCVACVASHTDLYVEQTCFSFGKSCHVENTTCQMGTIRSW